MKLGIRFIYHVLIMGFLVFCFFACSNNKSINTNNNQNNSEPLEKSFQKVSIPSNLTLPADQTYYLATHFWDNFDFKDTAYIHLSEITEQAFADYIGVLSRTQKEAASLSIKSMLSKSEVESTGKMYHYFLELYKKYLYDPNSPLRNEELYISVADYVINDSVSNNADKERAKFNLDIMQKNRLGHKANDFTYTLASGHNARMADLQSDYTLIYFYNPDCNACEEMTHYMKYSQSITTSIRNGKLKILAIYPDKDIATWTKHQNDIPYNWINSYDKYTVINNKRLYDLKAIPTIYLLDKDKKVLLKDVNALIVEHYLESVNPIL